MEVVENAATASGIGLLRFLLPCITKIHQCFSVATPSYDLVILAAGMGSRFGGLKQVQPVGPSGELIIEYSIYDAIRAGFTRLVLVIRKDIEADFRASIGKRLESRMDVRYVFQEVDALPAGYKALAGRTKPWGTGHAVLVAREAVQRPFAVINADDFYGASAYTALTAHFSTSPNYALVGYPLRQTLSEHGMVSRGLCVTDDAGRLQSITELTKIAKTEHGAKYAEADGLVHLLSGLEIVSMNFWGFTPAVFPQLEKSFTAFLEKNARDPMAEIYLPTAISSLIGRRETEVALLRSADSWFGITYREDISAARTAVQALVAAGKYPSSLWG